ncbi:MAG: hypothetical protein ACRDG6_09925 [Candidatus Limnocylindria bacterium]
MTGRRQSRSATVDRLLNYLLEGAPRDAVDEVAGDLAERLSASARFVSFADAHRDKIRKKLRGAAESEGRSDVRAELEVAFSLLADRRIELAFEAYGAGQRGPDFTVTFRAVHRFNLEVTRPRLDESDRPGRERANGIASALLGKLRQLPADAPNAVLVAVDGRPPIQDEVAAAIGSFRQRANRRDDIFFSGRGFANARHFHLQYLRLGALFVASRRGAGAWAWSNAEARRQLPDGALAACLGCLVRPAVTPK